MGAVENEAEFDWKNVWQVACGDGPRDYRELFLKFGLLAVGSEDDIGPYDEQLRPYSSGQGAKKLWPIAAAMQEGHTVILKKGKNIVAVGQIAGDYHYDGRSDWETRWSSYLDRPTADVPFSQCRLDDVDGWDLRHTRPVEWWAGEEMPCSSLHRSTVSGVNSDVVVICAKKFLTRARRISTVEPLPEPATVLGNEDLISFLMSEGLSSGQSEVMAGRLRMLQRLASWYQNESEPVSEHETRAYLVWPLLQALGWSEQCVKFEYRTIDLLVCREPVLADPVPGSVQILGETKRLFAGLNWALGQAEEYAKLYRPSVIVATDGVRYLMKRAEDGGLYYLNLLKLRDRHPFTRAVGGAPELLRELIRF